MTPVPYNFLSVTKSDYRVGVKLQAKHHLFRLLFVFALSLTRALQLCVSIVVFDEAVFNTKVI